jgi:oligosaccharide repeat unit polymerase
MSPEGVVRSNAKMVDYFSNKPFLFGESTGFIFYFWIPRSIWKEKPTMLGHWLIREYGDKGFGSGHSASFGFSGDFYADFGIPGAIFLSFLLGIGLKKLESIRIQSFYIEDERKILYAMVYPYVFFAVRSPITASITMIYILVVFFLLRRLLFKNLKVKKVKLFSVISSKS